jgi:hypothetical protein
LRNFLYSETSKGLIGCQGFGKIGWDSVPATGAILHVFLGEWNWGVSRSLCNVIHNALQKMNDFAELKDNWYNYT